MRIVRFLNSKDPKLFIRGPIYPQAENRLKISANWHMVVQYKPQGRSDDGQSGRAAHWAKIVKYGKKFNQATLHLQFFLQFSKMNIFFSLYIVSYYTTQHHDMFHSGNYYSVRHFCFSNEGGYVLFLCLKI